MLLLKYLCMSLFSAALVLLIVLTVLEVTYFHGRKRTALYFLFSVYLCAVYEIVGLLNVMYIQYIRFDPNINLIPLLGIVDDFRNSLMNVLLFVPLGVLLPLIWRKYRSFWKTAMFGLILSMTVELAQMFFGRATDINDLITNTCGAMLGFLCSRPVFKKIQAGERDDSILLAVLCAAVMFFVQPFVYSFLFEQVG